MSESFKNYLKNIQTSNVEFVVVPSGTNGHNTTSYSNGSDSYNKRDVNSVVQIHSIYISQEKRINGADRYNPKNFNSIDLYIRDINNPSVKIYVAYDIRIVPGSPYYIEKNITLEPSQYLCAYSSLDSRDMDIYNNNSLSILNSSVNLHLSVGSILIS